MNIEDMKRLMQDPTQLVAGPPGPNIFELHQQWLFSEEWQREVASILQKQAEDWAALADLPVG